MSEELEKYEAKAVDKKTIEDYLFTSETKLTEKQEAMFLQLALRNQLDPFKREIYAIPFGQNFSIVTGYQVYIQRAEATRKLNGWHCEAIKDGQGMLQGAKITIYRKDFDNPFEWEVSLKEFSKPQTNWQKMPEFMIKKVCIGQGFRLAFPNELGGLPYLQEEIEGKDVIDVTEAEIVEKTAEKVMPDKPIIKNPFEKATDKQIGMIHKICEAKQFDYANLKKILKIEHGTQLNKGAAGKLIEYLQKEAGYNQESISNLVGTDYIFKG